MEQAVHDDGVAGGHLLLGEGYLRHVILTLVGVVLCAVHHLLQRVLGSLNPVERIALRIGKIGQRIHAQSGNDGCVDALPVVYILALAPLALEELLALLYRHGVIEVPLAVGLLVGGVVGVSCVLVPVANGVVSLLGLLGVGLRRFVLFLFLLLFQSLDNAVDGFVALLGWHLGQLLQGVLQMYGFGEGHQLIEHLRTVRQLLIVVALLVEQSNGLAIASLGIAKFLLCPIQIAQLQQQHTFLNAVPCGLFGTLLIVGNGACGVFLGKVNVADGIINLVEIILVVVGCGHALEAPNHLLRLVGGQHLCLGNLGVELQLVRRVQANHLSESLVGFGLVSQRGLQLAHEVPFARALLLAHLVLDDVAQVGNGLGVVGRVDVVVGVGVVPLLARSPMQAVALHVSYDILGVVEEIVFYVALGQPSACAAVDGRLGGIEAAHVVERGGRTIKVALEKLGTSHEHPSLPQEGVVFFAVEPLQVFLRLAAVLGPFGLALDAMQLYGFFGFLDGLVKLALSQLPAGFVANGIKGDNLREIILVAGFFGQ